MEAIGISTEADGTTYKGNFRHGLKHGHGRLCLPDGSRYVGSFHNDHIHGEGDYTDAKGNTY